MTEVLLGLIAGCTLGLCVAPLWMMLQLPMRATDLCGGGGMPMSAAALAVGATLGALGAEGILPQFFGGIGMLTGGVFVGMVSAALVEAVEVVPILFDRLSITTDMRFAAAALAIGKGAGALIAGLMGGMQ